MDDDAWRATLGTEDRSPSRQKVAPDYAWVHEQMAFPDATLEQIWEEFRGTRLDSVGYLHGSPLSCFQLTEIFFASKSLIPVTTPLS